MLSDSQRAALLARLRQGRNELPAAIGARPAGLAELPLSYGQEQLWFLDQFAPGLPTYNIPLALRLSGPLDAAALARAVDRLRARHEALRTRLAPGPAGRPVQLIDPPAASPSILLPADTIDLSDLPEPDQSVRLHELIGRAAAEPFQLAAGPLLRGRLIRLSAREHILLVVVHHAVFDGWSAGLLVPELADGYRQEAAGQPSRLPELAIQFADYALWERGAQASAAAAQHERYWRDALGGFEPVAFPADRPRPVVDSFDGGLADRMTRPGLLDGLRRLSSALGTTPFVLLMAALQALLQRYTGQDDIVVGTVSANRVRGELAPLIGFLVNTLPIRVSLAGDPPFTELAGRAHEAVVGAYAHQDLPFARLVEALGVERDPGRSPVFQISLAYAERVASPAEAAGLELTMTDLVVGTRAAKFDLALLAEARAGGLWLECSYKSRLFDPGTVHRLLEHFEVLLAGVIADPSARLSRLPVLTGAELGRELREWSGTTAPVPSGTGPAATVPEAFEAQAAGTPDAVAAECGPQRVTYAELDRRADLVAGQLRAAGAGPEVLVGVCLAAGLPRLAALLGTWKAGAGYLPLDPGLPAGRLAFMLADARVPILLADETTAAALPPSGATLLFPAGQAGQAGVHGPRVAGRSRPASVAYVIYTSGSTGQPKGVLIEHRQALNFLHGMAAGWQVGPRDAVLQFASLSFDASVLDTFVALLAGARVVLAPAQVRHSPPRLAGLMRTAGITFTLLPSAVLSLLAGERFPALRVLLTGGEALTADVARRWIRPGLRFVNAYGPTEAAVVATCAELDAVTAAPPPIGRPAPPGVRVYLLDAHLNPVPAGVTGELHIGGAGVARGYLGRPGLTGQRFVADPFGAEPGARLYRTGDLARRRPDGSIVFAGRADGQVKIRGLRIELGEIEAAMTAHPSVAQAFVTVVTDQAGQPQLAAWLRPAPGTAAGTAAGTEPAGLRPHLAGLLPAHMIPACLVTVAELPLTTSGKIDRDALPAPQLQPTGGLAEPATVLESAVTGMFARLLGRERAGVTDGFFDLGGNSLAVMRLVALIHDELGTDIGAAAVFLAPSPRQLAALLRDSHGLADAGLGTAPAAAAGYQPRDGQASQVRHSQVRHGQIPRRPAGLTALPASHGQEQLWFLDRLAPGQSVYHVPVAITLTGPLDTAALSRAVDALLARHEVLRTRLVAGPDGRPVQMIDPPPPASPSPLRREELADYRGGGIERARQRLRTLAAEELRQPFRLAEGPLLRARLAALADEEHALLFMIHHAVFDGWSAGLLLTDLAGLYRAEVTGEPSGLAELPVQFADYALWERDQLHGEALAEHEDYWRRALDGLQAVAFPTDRPRPPVDSFDGAVSGRLADPGLLAGLRQLSRRERTTLFVTVLAAVHALLQRYTGQADIVVGTVSADRSRPELAPLIGFLVDTLPIRVDGSGDPPFTELLARVREAVLGGYEHQRLPFGRLVEALRLGRDAGRAPVFQIMLSYAEAETVTVTAAGAGFGLAEPLVEATAAKFDLDFLAEARPSGLWLECSYKTGLFDAGTVHRLLGHLETVLRGAASDPSARLSRLPVLTPAELRRELAAWNDTTAPVPAGCAHDGFGAQTAATPDAVAAECGPEQVSYQELSRRSGQIAGRLRAAGAGPEVLVGVCLNAGLPRLAALLAIWQAGAGYVPLDPALPPGRLAFMMADASLAIVLADEQTGPALPPSDALVLRLDAAMARPAGRAGEHRARAGVTPSNVAYVIYTSGSTGRPKGVAVEHRQLMSFLHAMIGYWRVGPRDRVLQFASLSFDASVHEIFMPLLAGGRVVVAEAQARHSPPRLAALIRDRRVTFACLTPSVASLLADQQLGCLRVLMCGGEELPAELARRWLRPGLRLANDYGPTETTVSALFCELAESCELDGAVQAPPPIGRPLANYQAYVLDAHLNPVPAGVTGELHIGGGGVARGYLGRPGLTGQRFVADPFGAEPGARLYRTGDLARRRPDGSIVFAGRADGQVKIRGLRIELGEIEAAMTAHPSVAQAVVTVTADRSGDRQLAGYLRPQSGAKPDPASLRAHLARLLPAYMIPSRLISIARLPLNSSGKVDRAALPAPDQDPAPGGACGTGGYAAPATFTEALLADLYATVLHRDRVGATDSFFDIGGSSLQVMRLITLISGELGLDVGVSTIFLHPAPRQLAARIDAIRSGAAGQDPAGPLVELAAGEGRLPLFLIHPVGGTVFGYAPLARELAGTFEVRGIQSPALTGPGPVPAGLGDLVTGYAARIQTAQPSGPYRLAGWSMGGVLAFEIARLLEADGAEVSLLVLLDAPFAIPAGAPGAQLAASFVADAALSLGWELADAPDPAAATAADQLAWLAGRLDAGQEGTGLADLLRRRLEVFSAHHRMLAGYRPAGRVRAATLIVSAAGSLNAPARDHWPQVLAGPAAVQVADGDHYTFLQPPAVTAVAASILKWHDGPPTVRLPAETCTRTARVSGGGGRGR